MKNAASFSVTLKEIADISAGYPLRGSADALPEGNVPLVQLKNVDPEAGIDWDEVMHVQLPPARKPKWLTDNDVIFASRGTRNYAYAISGGPEHSVCSPHFFVLSVKDAAHVNPEFLAWQINQKPAQDYLQRSAVGTQAIMTIRRPAVESLPLVLPPVREQNLIVKFWRASLNERAALNQLIEMSKQQSEAIAIDLIHRFKGAQP